MNKKIIISLVVILLLVAGGVFWWQDQKEVRELNKNLPEGVRVVKSLFGEEYKVVNKKDGYEFKVPAEWRGIEEIDYIPEWTEKEYTGTSVNLKGKEGGSRIVSIDRYKIEKPEVNLELWAKTNFETFGLIGDFSKDKIGKFEIVKTQEEVHLLGMSVYFFQKNSATYAITCGSEEFIRYIILNGKW